MRKNEWIDLSEAAKRINDASSGQWDTDEKELLRFCRNQGIDVVKQGKTHLTREKDLANALYHNTLPRS